MAVSIPTPSALSQTDRPVSDLVQRWLAKLPLPVFRAAGAAFGLALWALAHRRRHVVERNLELCFPEAGAAQRARWTRETFISFGQTFVDRVWLWHGDPQLVDQRVALTGRVDLLEQVDPAGQRDALVDQLRVAMPEPDAVDKGLAEADEGLARPARALRGTGFGKAELEVALDDMAAPVRQGPQRQAERRPGRAEHRQRQFRQPALDEVGDRAVGLGQGGWGRNRNRHYPESGPLPADRTGRA